MTIRLVARADFVWHETRIEFQGPDIATVELVSNLVGLEPHDADLTPRRWEIFPESTGWGVRYHPRFTRHYANLADAVALTAAWMVAIVFRSSTRRFLHGGAIIRDGAAHLFIGPSKIGKSTLALETWLAGGQVLSDDWVLVDIEAGTVEGVPKPMRVRLGDRPVPERLQPLLAEQRCHLGWVEQERSLLIGRTMPGQIPLGQKYPLGSLCLIERTGPQGVTGLFPADKMAMIDGVMRHAEKVALPPFPLLKPFLPLLNAGRVYRLLVGDGASAEASRLIGTVPPMMTRIADAIPAKELC